MTFDAVLFDCDGVLVDSEPVTLQVLQQMLAELGWHLSSKRCAELFTGRSSVDELALIQQRTGKKLGQDWVDAFRLRRNQALQKKLVPVLGIHEALAAITQRWPKIACASAADKEKIVMQLRMHNLYNHFHGHIHSGLDVARNKPYPDVYIAAAAQLQVDPQRCAIIEDSPTGIRAAVASGATVFAYSPNHESEALIEAGAHIVFHDMRQLHQSLEHYCRTRQ